MNKIEELLEKDGYYISTSKGSSMLPLLRDAQDTIIIRKKDTYNKYDIVLYTHNNTYILHRIIRRLDQTFLIRGDNCYYNEYIPDKDIIGVLDECYRGEKKINLNSLSYKLYVYIRVHTYPIRLLIFKIRKKLSRNNT